MIEYNKLDDNWIKIFEDTDKLYQDFYKDDVYYVNLSIFYVNKSNEIDKIKHQSLLLQNPNKISREEIIKIIKTYNIDNEKYYSLLSILKYNIYLEPDEINNFLIMSKKTLKTDDVVNPFLTIVKHIDTIFYEKTISMFQDLNDLIILFYEKPREIKNANNSTKKIYVCSLNNHKNTRKKY